MNLSIGSHRWDDSWERHQHDQQPHTQVITNYLEIFYENEKLEKAPKLQNSYLNSLNCIFKLKQLASSQNYSNFLIIDLKRS